MSGSTRRAARLLVVEDDRVARQLALEVMTLDGHETTEAASAEEALVPSAPHRPVPPTTSPSPSTSGSCGRPSPVRSSDDD